MKERIITELTKLGIIESALFLENQNTEEKEDLEFCMNKYYKWCKILNYDINYNSFYEFLSEYGEIEIEFTILKYKDNHYFKNILNFDNKSWIRNGVKKRIENSEFYYLLE